MNHILVALLWLCAAETAVGAVGEKTPLHFSYITTITGGFTIAGAIPVVDLALEQINNRTDILPNYTLNYTTILDSKVSENSYSDQSVVCTLVTLTHVQCNGTASLDAFMEHFRGVTQPTYVSLMCCGCSTATIPVAEVSHYWNIPQVQ